MINFGLVTIGIAFVASCQQGAKIDFFFVFVFLLIKIDKLKENLREFLRSIGPKLLGM